MQAKQKLLAFSENTAIALAGDIKMYSQRFQQFIDMWRKDFAIERSMNEKVCLDRDGNPIPWYTYPAIEYLSQFD